MSLRLVGEVVVVEEPGEEDEVAGVHEQRKVDVLVGYAALESGLFDLNRRKSEKFVLSIFINN